MKIIYLEMDLVRRVVFLDLDALSVVAVSRVSINESSFAGGSNRSLLSSSDVGGHFSRGNSLNFAFISSRRILAALLTT